MTKKDKRRITLLMFIFIPLLIMFVSRMFSYWSVIYSNVKEKKELELKYKEILEREDLLKSEISKLEDEEYVARYAREKFLYSKDGEIIIKLD
ncbi:septum formation initiator [Clostridium sp. CAG:628]|jgi:cell division protein DivIC|nr:septum formation initiator [Clostridium sp. CAG:628]